MTAFFLFSAAFNGILVILLGAMGSHALEQRLSADMLAVWHTGVQYHMFHITGLMIVLQVLVRMPEHARAVELSGKLFLAGIVLFSGSLYLLALTGQSWLGLVTPFGGLAFLAGWGQLARVTYRAWRA